VTVVGFALLTSFAIGAVMENRRFSGALEWIRLLSLIVSLALLPLPNWIVIVLSITSLIGVPLLFFGRQAASRREYPIKAS
jgi:hypothetical protein